MKRFLLQCHLAQASRATISLLLVVVSFSTFAQTKPITGTVKAGTGEPQPGVSVYEKGTSNGTISDASGAYSITVSEGAILVFSSIGLITQEIVITNQTVVDVTLREDTKMLDDVVVIGYGEQKRSNVTGAVTTVKVADMQNKSQLRLDQALQGMAAGVTVARDGGSPGARPTIHIRGIGSISDTEPLWIVDGVRMDPGNQFEIDDVESMEILKDASAAAIYGVKAAHGVILVTTKRGKGEPKITFKTSISKRQPVNLPKLLNSEDFVAYRKEGRLNAGQNPDPSWDNYEHDTDWMSAFYNGSGVLQSYDVSISKGDDKSNYFLSFGHDNEEGILIDNNFKRYSVRLNSDVKVAKWIKIGESMLVSRVTENPIGKNNENSSGAIPYRSIPIMPIHDPNNPYGGWGMGPAYFNGPNPVATQYQQHETKAYNRIDGNAYVELTPVQGLSIKGTLGYNYFGFAGERFEEAFDYGTFADPINKLMFSSATSQSILGNIVATYSKTINKHSFKVMGGFEGFKYDPSSLNATGTGYIVDVAQSFNLTGGSIGVPDRYQPLAERMQSQFGRINYSYNDRYLIEGNIRRDAVGSKFAPAYRWGVFPSVSVGWRISEEEFFQNVPVINTLKVRASAGKLGSDNSSAFIWQSTYTTQFSTYSFDDKGTVKVPGYYIARFANGEVQWEEINVYNVAIDTRLLNNKLSFTFELYRRDTNKLLYPVQIPSSVGIATHNFDPVSPQVNIGTLRNTGIDIELGYTETFGDFQLTTSGNASFLKNKVISLVGDAYVMSGYGGEQIGGMSRTQPGHPISSFYGYVVQQMLNSAGDVYAINTYAEDGFYQYPETGPGDLMYKDLNPSDDNSEITADDDRTFIGNPWPKMTYALNIGVVFRNMVDISLQFQGVAGVDVFNAGKAYSRNFFGDNNSTTLIKDAWTPDNHTNHPRNIANDPNRNFGSPSTYFVEDGSYLKLRNLQIGFTLPGKYLEKLRIKKLRIYANANNLLTFTKYSGPDPEIAGSNLSRGIDYGQYPQVRTFGAGLEVQF
jgi:TonB-linked SusC/RagA family outer membrane protein